MCCRMCVCVCVCENSPKPGLRVVGRKAGRDEVMREWEGGGGGIQGQRRDEVLGLGISLSVCQPDCLSDAAKLSLAKP